MTPLQVACNDYIRARTGRYEWRRVRYLAAQEALLDMGLTDEDTVIDVGAGWTELDYCLRRELNWRGRYHPIDGGLDGTDINYWLPANTGAFIVALEIIEHLRYPLARMSRWQAHARGIVVSTPNPETTDVLGMDPTHVTPVTKRDLDTLGFSVEERSFYGQPSDSLFATWRNTYGNG